jgi:hypothetical protein
MKEKSLGRCMHCAAADKKGKGDKSSGALSNSEHVTSVIKWLYRINWFINITIHILAS